MIRIILKESRSNQLNGLEFLRQIDELNKAVRRTVGTGSRQDELNLWKKIIDEIRPLKDSRIIDLIGKGWMGAAFELSNGNILKIGQEASSSSKGLPKKLSTAQKIGAGSAQHLHLYDFGEIQHILPHQEEGWSEPSAPWTWREVPKYIPFEEWVATRLFANRNEYERKGRYNRLGFEKFMNPLDRLLSELDELVSKYRDKVGTIPQFSVILKYLRRAPVSYNENNLELVLKLLGEKDTVKLLRSAYDLLIKKEGSAWLDLKADNLGVDQHGNFVFFDF